MSHKLIVGLGSHCGDDCAGWLVIDRLRELGFPADRLRQVLHAAEILDVIGVDRDLVVCDACESAEDTGTVHRWSWPSNKLATLRQRGTHDVGLDGVLRLASELNQCPARVDIWAVTGRNWSPGAAVATAMVHAAHRTAELIWSLYKDA